MPARRTPPQSESARRRRALVQAAGMLALVGQAPNARAQTPAPDAPGGPGGPAAAPSQAAEPPASPATAEPALLTVFNDSGPTLIPGNQIVTDNGVKRVSLPRRTYAQVPLSPGRHLLKPEPPLWKQQVLIEAVPGGRYFVVVAYRPERSWAAPLAGAPLVLYAITEEQAAPLLADMKALPHSSP